MGFPCRTCPSGYGVVTSDQTGTTGFGAAVAHLTIVSAEQNHELLVQCRGQMRIRSDHCNEDAAKDCPAGNTVVTLKQSQMGIFKKFHMTMSCHEDAVDP